MVINLRGTSGSGKSTIVRKLMEKYVEKIPIFEIGRKQPTGYICRRESGRTLFVPGHYETACGGCDTINGMDVIYQMIHEAIQSQQDVIFEGLIVASDTKRCIELQHHDKLMVIELSTPLEECLAGIQARRDARGDTRPLSDKNTRAKMGQVKTQRIHWQRAGVDFRILSREDAIKTVLEAFQWNS